MSSKHEQAIAEAIDTLCLFALADTAGTIHILANTFPKALKRVSDGTKEILIEGLGYKPEEFN